MEERPDIAVQRPGVAEQMHGVAVQRPGVTVQRPGVAGHVLDAVHSSMANRSVAGINANKNRFEVLTKTTPNTTKQNAEGFDYGPPLKERGSSSRCAGRQSKLAEHVTILANKLPASEPTNKVTDNKNLNDDKEQPPQDPNIITETTNEVIIEEDKREGEEEEEYKEDDASDIDSVSSEESFERYGSTNTILQLSSPQISDTEVPQSSHELNVDMQGAEGTEGEDIGPKPQVSTHKQIEHGTHYPGTLDNEMHKSPDKLNMEINTAVKN